LPRSALVSLRLTALRPNIQSAIGRMAIDRAKFFTAERRGIESA
jgi:hypothetical protein